MTPHELNLHIRDYSERSKTDLEERVTMAYLTAAWSRAAKLPDLKSTLRRMGLGNRPKKTQTAEEMVAVAKMIHTSVNGRNSK